MCFCCLHVYVGGCVSVVCMCLLVGVFLLLACVCWWVCVCCWHVYVGECVCVVGMSMLVGVHVLLTCVC